MWAINTLWWGQWDSQLWVWYWLVLWQLKDHRRIASEAWSIKDRVERSTLAFLHKLLALSLFLKGLDTFFSGNLRQANQCPSLCEGEGWTSIANYSFPSHHIHGSLEQSPESHQAPYVVQDSQSKLGTSRLIFTFCGCSQCLNFWVWPLKRLGEGYREGICSEADPLTPTWTSA